MNPKKVARAIVLAECLEGDTCRASVAATDAVWNAIVAIMRELEPVDLARLRRTAEIKRLRVFLERLKTTDVPSMKIS